MELILLQAGGDIVSILGGMWPLFLIILVFYFFIIRPQTQKQKEQGSFVDSLEKGQEVVTASGIIGKINKIEEHIITLQVDTKTFIRVTKGAISKDMTESVLAIPAANEKTS